MIHTFFCGADPWSAQNREAAQARAARYSWHTTDRLNHQVY